MIDTIRDRTFSSIIAFVLCTLVVALEPRAALQAVLFAMHNLIAISPMMLAGLLLTAGMMASNAMKLILTSFEGRMVSMIVLSSLIGAITPVCGATVLPLIAGLLMARVPLAPIMAFWLSSPITDPAMLLLTGATLGWPFALAKTLGAVLAGLFGGIITLKFSHSNFISNPMKSTHNRALSLAFSSHNERPVLGCFWKESARVKQFTSTLISTGKLMLVWLFLAFIAEFYLNQYLPLDWLPQLFGKESFWAIPLAALIGAPIYLDGYAALPLIRSLMDAGMRPDAALTFLIAGGITSAWAAIPVYALVNKKVFLLYLALAASASILAGLTLGSFL